MFLIVDDQKDIGAGLERLLRYAGHEAISVTGGPKRWFKFIDGRP